jgi:hypothetical protein
MDTDGAITVKDGTVFLNKGSAAAMTLAAPVSGLPSAGGDDGKMLRIVDVTGFAHAITTPANKINGNKLTVTLESGSPLAGAKGNAVTLRAQGGVWYCEATSSFFVLS